MKPSATTTEALARSDRYLLEFIEALNICPYARSCRELGRLHREVLEGDPPQVATVVERIRALEPRAEGEVEVALLIMPEVRLEARPFERFVGEVRKAYEGELRYQARFFMMPFHPELKMDLSDPDRAVTFMRRTPDPTIQLVSVAALEQAKEGAGDRRRLSEVIAEAGLEAVQRAGAEHIARLLAGLRPGGSHTPR